MLNRIRHLGQSFISGISWWLFAPPWDERRQKFYRSFSPRFWNIFALIGGLAVGGLIMWASLSSGESVASSVLWGLLAGAFGFVLYYFAGKLFNKYVTPALSALMGAEPSRSEPPPWKGRQRKRAWVIYAVLIGIFIWATFWFWKSMLGAWGLLATLAWLGLVIGHIKFIQTRKRRLTKHGTPKRHDQKTKGHTDMQEHGEVTGYLSTVAERLKADGFKITENVTYKNQTLKCVAKRTRWQLEYFGFAEFLFIFKEFSELNRTSLREFSDVCYKYACRSKIIPLANVPFDYAYCFPIALVTNLDEATAQAIRSEDPPRLFAGYEMPVICDIVAKKIYYSEQSPRRGALYHEHFREIVRTILSP